MIVGPNKAAQYNATAFFDSMNEKLSVLRAFNNMCAASGIPKPHEGMDQTSIEFKIFIVISETPVMALSGCGGCREWGTIDE